MRPLPFAVFAALLCPSVLAQALEWRQSPLTGRLYALTQPLTWSQARTQAQALGGDLAVVRNAAEQAWLRHQFVGSQCLWVGLTDSAIEGSFRWVSGANAIYTDWAPGQPDNAGAGEDFVALSPLANWPLGADGQWLDLAGTFVCPGVIELEPRAGGRARELGLGCPGSNGVPTLTPFAPAPVPGSNFPVQFSGLPLAPGPVLAGLGFPRPMPLSLAQFGMPGCEWWGDNVAAFVLNNLNTTGNLSWALPIPSTSLAVGVAVRLQGAVIDPPANTAGVTVTNGLALVYGAGLGEVSYDEVFGDDSMLARELSGGSWTGGAATFAKIGGDGRHGTFDPVVLGSFQGTIAGKDTYEIDTDNTIVPATVTLSGQQLTVTDGRFFFDRMVVDSSVRVRFVGQSPPVLTVAGQIEVLGEIDVQGSSNDYPTGSLPAGQSGAAGGAFGGDGGKGGDKGTGIGHVPANDGENGENASVRAGRAYAVTVDGSGGQGSLQFPLDGLKASVYYAPSPVSVSYSPTATAGGGGGGLAAPGEDGEVVSNNHVDPGTGVPPLLSALGPDALGGSAVQFFPFPAPAGSTKSSVHFLVGGAGGGGAGSNAALSLDVLPASSTFVRGAGGAGGGGALGLRAGDSLTVTAAAAVLASGGSTGGVTATFGTAAPAPGGAGSGGSVLLQTDGTANVAGSVDVLGGTGGTYDRMAGAAPPIGAHVIIKGGDGGPGFVRLETAAGATPAELPNMTPAATADNAGQLTEVDDLASSTSRVFDTRTGGTAVPTPEYLRYEIEAMVDGVAVRFSDDPSVSTMRADPGAPVQFWIRGSVPTQPNLLFPWRPAVRSQGSVIGLDVDGVPAFQFRLVADRAIASSIVVHRVRVVYRL